MSESKLPRRVPLTKVDFAKLAECVSYWAEYATVEGLDHFRRDDGTVLDVDLEQVVTVLIQCRDAIETMPRVIMENRGAQVVETSLKIANAMDVVAQKHDRGALPIVTPQTALREFAASLRKAVFDMQQPEKPKRKLEIVRA